MEGIHYFTEDELRRLLTYCKRKDYRLYSMIYMAFTLGLRVSEVIKLKESDIDFGDNRIYIRRQKGSNATQHPLSKEQKQILTAALKHKSAGRLFHFHRSTLDRKLKAVCSRIRIVKYKAHFHTLKHTAAIMLLRNGTDIRTIQTFLGHKSIDSTLQYLQITGQDIDKASVLLDSLF